MRSLYLVRHAKSSWAEPGLNDSSRPLNGRGKHDAPLMGKLLKKLGASPEVLITSPAKRAKSTAKRIAAELSFDKKNLVENDQLYLADIDDFIDVIKKVQDKHKEIMIFSHNYGITDFANYISDSGIENIPTCGTVRIDFDLDSWDSIKEKKGKLVFFEYPKKSI